MDIEEIRCDTEAVADMPFEPTINGSIVESCGLWEGEDVGRQPKRAYFRKIETCRDAWHDIRTENAG